MAVCACAPLGVGGSFFFSCSFTFLVGAMLLLLLLFSFIISCCCCLLSLPYSTGVYINSTISVLTNQSVSQPINQSINRLCDSCFSLILC